MDNRFNFPINLSNNTLVKIYDLENKVQLKKLWGPLGVPLGKERRSTGFSIIRVKEHSN